VRLVEAAPDDLVIPQRNLDLKGPATRLAAHAAEDSDLAFSAVVVCRRLTEQAGRRQEDFLGRQSGVAASEIRLPLSHGERQLDLSQNVYEVAAVEEDGDGIDDPAPGSHLSPIWKRMVSTPGL
jgi:hypothetical protein